MVIIQLRAQQSAQLLSTQIASAVEAILSADRSVAGACRAAALWLTALSRGSAALAADLRLPERQVACAAGCSGCCDNVVVVRPLEAILVAVHAQRNLPPDRLAGIYRQLGSHSRPCPLLFEGQCSIYEARPGVCRAYYSFDAALCERGQACERSLDGVKFTPPRLTFLMEAVIRQSVDDVCRRLGLHSESLRLHLALGIIYSTPDAVERWLAGERVFASAEVG